MQSGNAHFDKELTMSQANEQASISDGLAIATRFHQTGDLPQAELLYRQILQRDPKNADALHQLGMLAHQVGRNEIAVEMIEAAIVANPAIPAYCNTLGVVRRAQGDSAGAKIQFERALALDPTYAAAHVNLGNLAEESGDMESAAARYKEALQHQFTPATLNNLGRVLLGLGKSAEALEQYALARGMDPNDPEAFFGVGNAQRALGHWEEAIKAFRTAIDKGYDYAEVQFSLGLVYQAHGQADEARAAMARALELNPDFSPAQEWLTKSAKSQ
jgi:protein O-GlcNAc transferase